MLRYDSLRHLISNDEREFSMNKNIYSTVSHDFADPKDFLSFHIPRTNVLYRLQKSQSTRIRFIKSITLSPINNIYLHKKNLTPGVLSIFYQSLILFDLSIQRS